MNMTNSNRLNNNNKFKQSKVLTEKYVGYKGKKKIIELLSSWEFKAVNYLEQLYKLKRIDGWSSEESVFEYLHSLDNKMHKYYMDFTLLKGDKVVFVEVKPFKETIVPKKPKEFKTDKQQRSYQKQVQTYIKNQDKWVAVKEWCKIQNELLGVNKYKFVIWTENELSIKK